MRTIIINTLGSELRQNPLFYLPFQSGQFHWIEKELPGVAACSQEIASYQSKQGQRQDYHLILLVSLAQLPSAELASVRDVYIQLLSAYLNESLLYPLCQQQSPPVGVSVIFMLQEKVDGQGDVETDRELDRIFGFREDMQQLPALILKDKAGGTVLDLSTLFEDAVAGYNVSLENQSREPMAGANYALEQLRRHIFERLKSRQECLYIPVGMDKTTPLNCQRIEFAPRTTEWDMCCVDLQLNLSEHLQKNLNNENVWKLELVPHGTDELQERIQLAIARVQHLQNNSPQLAFYSLTTDHPTGESICGDIWEKLRACDPKLPGVEEAYLDAQLDKQLHQSTIEKEKESLSKKLRQTWLLVGLAKKRFDGYYNILQAQYAPEVATKQQESVLNICANTFLAWRRKLLSRRIALPTQVTESEMPTFDRKDYESRLQQAQQEWGQAAVSQLEDYADVREEAEKVKADFRKAYRLWPDGQFNATSKFCVYSIVLALLFIMQMLLPYIGITMGQNGVELSRYVHFLLSLLMFAGLYAVGVLVWMRALCKQLNRYTRRIYWLLQDSHFRRRRSIVSAVESYGRILPRCADNYEQLQQLLMIHEENLQRKERYNSHMKLLNKASELLYELCTSLRMSDTASKDVNNIKGGIDFELAPSHTVNAPYYAFLSENWGGGV